jgi:fermentation-respiration switch protein FrsA (DUF1100 family)
MVRKMHLLVLTAAVVGSVAGCPCLENRLVYQPIRCAQDPLPPLPPLQDLKLPTAVGATIHARWCPHPDAQGAVLFCHGNGGNLDHRALVIREIWEALGESVLIFDYPGYGFSEGEPSEAGCYAAAEAAYDWLTRTKRVPPERLLIFGESLGGGVAVELAGNKSHRALILVRTFTSVPDVAQAQFPLLPVRWLMTNRFDSLARLGACKQPIFIASADSDRVVPFSHGQRLLAASKAPAEFFQLKGADHNDPLSPEFYTALRHFLQTHARFASGSDCVTPATPE